MDWKLGLETRNVRTAAQSRSQPLRLGQQQKRSMNSDQKTRKKCFLTMLRRDTQKRSISRNERETSGGHSLRDVQQHRFPFVWSFMTIGIADGRKRREIEKRYKKSWTTHHTRFFSHDHASMMISFLPLHGRCTSIVAHTTTVRWTGKLRGWLNTAADGRDEVCADTVDTRRQRWWRERRRGIASALWRRESSRQEWTRDSRDQYEWRYGELSCDE